MNLELKENLQINKVIVALSFICAALSIFVVSFGEFFVPFPAALLSIIILLEEGRKRIFSILLSAYFVLLNLLAIFLMDAFIFSGLEVVLLSIALSICFSKKVSKFESAFALCCIAVAFIFLNAMFFAMTYTREYSFESVSVFYNDLYSGIKSLFLSSLSDLRSALPEQSAVALLSSDNLIAVLDSIVALIPSYVALIAFAVAGITLKVFSFTAFKLTGNSECVKTWRFNPSSVYAYFYLALFLLTVFVGSTGSLIAVSVANLSNIFGIVFAYVGFVFVQTLLSAKHSPIFSFALLLLGLVLFSSLMIEILSVIGAFVTLSNNKLASKK